MKKTYLAIALATASFFACNSGTSSNTADSTTNSSSMSDSSSNSTMGSTASSGADTSTAKMNAKPLSDMDKQFMMDAAAGGNTEIMASQAAVSMAKSQRVKDYANMMISDHTKAGNELKAMASQKNVTLSDSLPAAKKDAVESLKKMSGSSFDKQYMTMMVKDHKETVEKFQMATQKCEDSDLKTWAANTLPTLKMHTDSAVAVQKSLK